jgi:AraC family transcriptional regulator
MARGTNALSTSKAPKGWFLSGKNPELYTASVDTTNPHSGTKCGLVESGPTGCGKGVWTTLMQLVTARQYLGQRLQLSLWIRTEDAGGVQPWMRLDERLDGGTIGFDNMCNRKIKGASDWAKYSMVLDVPHHAINLAFGVILHGEGKLWIDDVELNIVGEDVPVTDCPCSPNSKPQKVPTNLNFEEG